VASLQSQLTIVACVMPDTSLSYHGYLAEIPLEHVEYMDVYRVMYEIQLYLLIGFHTLRVCLLFLKLLAR
jgi:hypothetical protein